MLETNPIGIFDSGVGGLSIAHAIKETLPGENLAYYADFDFSPYGTQPTQLIEQRSDYIVDFLIARGCKAIVVACNTATVNSIHQLRSKFSVPIIGVEPGIKPASLKSNTGVVGVLATERTLNSESFHALKQQFIGTTDIRVQACPKFVELVEKHQHMSCGAVDIVEQYVQPLLSAGCDHIVLGCTHFSFLKPLIEEIAGNGVTIVDTAIPVAMEVKRRLDQLQLTNVASTSGTMQFWSSGNSLQPQERMNALWFEGVSP